MTDAARGALQASGLFVFLEGAGDRKVIEGLVDFEQANRYGGLHPLIDHIGIAAAEFAVVESGVAEEWSGYPVSVSLRHVRMASLKYDCTLGDICVPFVPSEGLILDRVAVLSADIARIWRILAQHGGIAKLNNGPSELHAVVHELEDVYAGHPSDAVRQFLARDCVRVQGLLWRMQLTTASHPGFVGVDPEEALQDSAGALGLLGDSG
ncbi:hypothetical protein [Streptomyces griseosporeus]|uniref:hypothetical protein n=1 Tax=Streptomyces griseosporeus TaxID=1910 RepID=UPI0036FD4D2F